MRGFWNKGGIKNEADNSRHQNTAAPVYDLKSDTTSLILIVLLQNFLMTIIF